MNIRQAVKEKLKKEVDSILAEATILHAGWEMDNTGWVVKLKDGSVKAFTTNHGGLCEWDKEEALQSIRAAEDSANSIREALKLFKS